MRRGPVWKAEGCVVGREVVDKMDEHPDYGEKGERSPATLGARWRVPDN